MELQKLQQGLQNDMESQIYIELYVNADNLDIQTITNLTGINPTETSDDEDIPAEISFEYWRYKSEYMNTNDTNKAISTILTNLKNNMQNIVKYMSKLERVVLGMCVVVQANGEPCKINISRENIEILSEINCLLQFDII